MRIQNALVASVAKDVFPPALLIWALAYNNIICKRLRMVIGLRGGKLSAKLLLRSLYRVRPSTFSCSAVLMWDMLRGL